MTCVPGCFIGIQFYCIQPGGRATYHNWNGSSSTVIWNDQQNDFCSPSKQELQQRLQDVCNHQARYYFLFASFQKTGWPAQPRNSWSELHHVYLFTRTIFHLILITTQKVRFVAINGFPNNEILDEITQSSTALSSFVNIYSKRVNNQQMPKICFVFDSPLV